LQADSKSIFHNGDSSRRGRRNVYRRTEESEEGKLGGIERNKWMK
jgi:hypothetical protein